MVVDLWVGDPMEEDFEEDLVQILEPVTPEVIV